MTKQQKQDGEAAPNNVFKDKRDSEAAPNNVFKGKRDEWQPRIVAFFCNWCTYTAADLAGVSRIKYAPNARVIRVMCSGRVDPQFILEAFARGADGVLMGGCHPGDCHYSEGNYKALKRAKLLKKLLKDMCVEEDRFRLEWISGAEGEKVKLVIDDMVEKVRKLGPLDLPGRFAEWDKEISVLEEEIKVKEEKEGVAHHG